jgi:hypothetical protein
MKTRLRSFCTFLVLAETLAQIHSAHASFIIDPGSQLLEFEAGSATFLGQPFEGVPLGTFNFGGIIGIQDVGPTDMIIRRLSTATVASAGNSATVTTAIDALQLKSVGPVSLMGELPQNYYVALSSRSGGPVSTGTMTINFGPEGEPHGTFSSSFNLFVDIHTVSLDGPIFASRNVIIPDSLSGPWGHQPEGPIQIQGVNVDLNGVNSDNDFWLIGDVFKVTPNGSIKGRNAGTSVPDAGSTLLLLSLALIGIERTKASWSKN